MKLDSMLRFHKEVKDLDFADAFKYTNSGKSISLVKVEYEDGLYKFSFQGSTIAGLDTKTIKQYFTYGVSIDLTFSDNLFSTSLHSLTLKNIYKDIRRIVIQHTATQMINELGLHECLVYSIVTRHNFAILKPYKMLRPYIGESIDTTKLLVNKNGAIATYEPPFRADQWGLVKRLEKEVIRQLCKPLIDKGGIDD